MRLTSRPARYAAAFGLCLTIAVPMTASIGPDAALARGAPDSFADLAAKLLPAVVNVSSTQSAQPKVAQGGQPGGPQAGPEIPMFPPGSPFEQFFKDFLNRGRPGQQGEGQARPEHRAQSLGSGFIVDASGLVVTNNHVIDGADEISVSLQDNTTLKAELVGRDETGDIALLRVKADKPLPTVEFGDSNTSRVGDWVLAIGNPFGLGGTVTAGIVSARSRDIRQGPYDDVIQTDAAINKGNSGGPLFNMDGKVIGINTAIFSPSGGSIGIGFAIPASLAQPVVAQLKDHGRVERGLLGVQIQPVTDEIASSLSLGSASGALVAQVEPDSSALKAGIQSGDVIRSVDGKSIDTVRDLTRTIGAAEPGSTVKIALVRDGKDMTVQAKLGDS